MAKLEYGPCRRSPVFHHSVKEIVAESGMGVDQRIIVHDAPELTPSRSVNVEQPR